MIIQYLHSYMNGQLTFYRKLQLKNDPFNAAKSEHCSWILGVISPELFPVIPVSSADVSSHLSYVELLVVGHIRRSSWEINEELTVLQKLKRLMTLKGATKHICGGKRGNSVVVLIAHSLSLRESCVTKHKFGTTSNCWNDPVGFPAPNFALAVTPAFRTKTY